MAGSGHFWVPNASAAACWDAFDKKLGSLGHHVNVRSECNFTTASIAQGSDSCKNISTVQILQRVVPVRVLSDISVKCTNASADQLSSCSACTAAVVQATNDYMHVETLSGSINSCQDLLPLYGASTMPNTASRMDVATCLLNLMLHKDNEATHSKFVFGSIGAAVTVVLAFGVLLSIYFRYRMHRITVSKRDLEASKEKMAKSNCNLTWYTLDEIKAATDNFSVCNVLGSGGFGSVYKGVLPDGTHVAMKRFKNCSPAGDEEFFHEVEVISSVKHRNLVALRGCCVDKSDPRGHQRIIVYEYMPNGSLHDHLFSQKTFLDWPKRKNIALGIVRGLVYLHQDVQPAIIHRDIKSSNILLDSHWNARVADFGLAKFTPEGATHVTTRVAGTHGYVAPEYVLYGKINEKSDVYSFGVLLLELLTGQKIISFLNDSEGPLLITDWAWSLVKEGKIGDVLDPHMDNLGPPEVVEKYVRIALLCSHPHVSSRPTIDQVLKLMETDQPLPLVPDRPPPYTVAMSDLEKTAGNSGVFSSSAGFRSFSSQSDLAR